MLILYEHMFIEDVHMWQGLLSYYVHHVYLRHEVEINSKETLMNTEEDLYYRSFQVQLVVCRRGWRQVNECHCLFLRTLPH